MDCDNFLNERIAIFKALGDKTRLGIVQLLASNTIDKICVSDVAKLMNITQPAASQHIKILKNVGILRARKEGNRVYYYVDIKELEKERKAIDLLFDMAYKKCVSATEETK